MSYMFYRCDSLLLLPKISNWNTSKVNDKSYMFYGCKSLPEILNWDTSKVNDMSYMFYECISLISLPDISSWTISKVNDIRNGILLKLKI